MEQALYLAGSIAGGLGLFLLAVGMITDGLKLAAGDALSDMLGKWTHSTGRGILAGLTITAIVQSSGAVTVASIGFVNAGLLSLSQALGVIYGTNIGTTITGWLVASVGFNIKIGTFALPLVGIGMLLRLTGLHTRRGAIGIALAGFGLFFIGIDILKTTFESIAATSDIINISAEGIYGTLLFLWIGFIMTVLTQSSSASIAIVLTAATGGLVTLPAAAAMVIGANVGTTTLAAIVAIGATSNAKRVALAHIFFNLITAGVALIGLPFLLPGIQLTGTSLGLENSPAITLALFHTVFNIIGVALLWPMTNRLSLFLQTCFRTSEEIESKPRFLDKTVIISPSLALNALSLELNNISRIVRRMSMGAISTELAAGKLLESDHLAVNNLTHEVETFITQMQQRELPTAISENISLVLQTSQHLMSAAEIARRIAASQISARPLRDAELAQLIADYKSEIVNLITNADISAANFNADELNRLFEEIKNKHHALKEDLHNKGAHLRLNIHEVTDNLEMLSRSRRLAKNILKATHEINALYKLNKLMNTESKTQNVETVENPATENQPASESQKADNITETTEPGMK